MKKIEINSTYLASDVYKRWLKIIRCATTDITIFTPYFDKALLKLLKANTGLARMQLTIVTDISPENALEMPYQLKAAKKALSLGIVVRSLEGLHAKVLLVDGNRTSVGSQNFTERGRLNKEATVLPAIALGDSHFVKTLHEWLLEARVVTEEEIDELLAQLKPFFRQHKKMHEAIEVKVSEVLARQALKREAASREQKARAELKKANLLRDQLLELERQSVVRLKEKFLYATIRRRDSYQTLVSKGDMTNWESKNKDGSFSPMDLDWLHFYPIMFWNTKRMAFARVGKRQITYIRGGVEWDYGSWMVSNLSAKVSLSFPKSDTERRNIVAKVSANEYFGSCEFEIFFNGQVSEIRGVQFSKGKWAERANYDQFSLNLKQSLLDSEDALNAFLKKFLGAFEKYKRLGRERKNVMEYFDRQLWYRISLIQAQGNPLLVFNEDRA